MNVEEKARMYLEGQADRFRKGRHAVYEKRKSWESFEKAAVQYIDFICKSAKESELFEYLYYETKTKPNVLDPKSPPFINIFFGQHPTGLYDFTAPENVRALDAEGGCALSISQAPTGEVVCFLFPFQSSLRKATTTRYIYKVFKSPSKIGRRKVHKLIKKLFLVAHHTSYFGDRGTLECLIYNWFLLECWITENLYCDAFMKMLIKLIGKLTEDRISEKIKAEE